jgi:hypothetical protein
VPALRAVTEFLVAISLVIALVSNYLIINKLWKRRAVREVADSISVGAALLGLSTALPFLVLFVAIDHSPAGAAKTAIGVVTGIVFVLIGSGLWVAEFRNKRFFTLLVRSLKQERREAGDLVRALVQPKGADRILLVLQQLAAVDGHLDEKEAELIRTFAHHWRMDVPDTAATDGKADLLTLRQSVSDYLSLHPPRDQAAHLIDVLHLLSRADSDVSWEEKLALDEIEGMMRHYLVDDVASMPTYEVLIVPQSEPQIGSVRSLLPSAEEKRVRGGRVFSVGHYYSANYAEMVCQKYIALGLFTTLVTPDQAVEPLQPHRAG